MIKNLFVTNRLRDYLFKLVISTVMFVAIFVVLQLNSSFGIVIPGLGALWFLFFIIYLIACFVLLLGYIYGLITKGKHVMVDNRSVSSNTVTKA